MLIPTEAIAAAERLKANAGARVHRLGRPDELEEERPMPRGVYDRQKAAAKPAEPKAETEAPPAKKRGRKPAAEKPAKAVKPAPRKSGAQAIFAVDSTGAIAIRRGDFGMELSPGEAQEFVGFLRKIGVPA